MRVDGNIGGGIDGTGGGDLAGIAEQVAAAERAGYDGVWTTEVSRDPFLPLLLAAGQSRTLTLGTAVAVAFARNPMTLAMVANDLQSFSSGRLVLGLGSQIKAHIQRRFSMPWSEPAARMREFVLALRAIWASWQDGSRLDFRGEFYQHTLMTPMFSPPPNPCGPPPVLLAAVGPRMTTVAAEVADGMLVHGFTTERYLREITLPLIHDGLHASGRSRDRFSICYPGLVAAGDTDRDLEAAVAAIREQLAFYGATPAYRPVLDLHGWGDLHADLHQLSVRGQWAAMTGLMDDTVLHTFAVVGRPDRVGPEIHRRFGDIIDRYTLCTPYPMSEQARLRIVTSLQHATRTAGPPAEAHASSPGGESHLHPQEA
jgi:probable F420-dependent oxidoreductase